MPIKDLDDKRQITATFALSSTGHFLPIQVIYNGKTTPCLPKFQFPKCFSVTFSENHWSNTEKSVECFEEIIFPYLKKVKEEKGFPNEQVSLIIMDTFKGQDNDTMKELCAVNHCEIVIVPHNLTNKFQQLDISVSKAAKSYISIKYNEWLSDQVTSQLLNGRDPTQVKVPTNLRDIKPMQARWIVDLYNYLPSEREMITHGFDSAGITEAVTRAYDVMMKVANPFRE